MFTCWLKWVFMMCSVRICTVPPLFTASKLFLEPHCWRNATLSIIVHGRVILINTMMVR